MAFDDGEDEIVDVICEFLHCAYTLKSKLKAISWNEDQNIMDTVTSETYWSKIDDVTALISKESTTFSLVFSAKPWPNVTGASGLTIKFSELLTNYCVLVCSMPTSIGELCCDEIKAASVNLIESVISLIVAVKSFQNISKRTGAVWEMCELMSKVARTSTAVVLSKLRTQQQLVHDALSELEETEEIDLADYATVFYEPTLAIIRATKAIFSKLDESCTRMIEVGGPSTSTNEIDELKLNADAKQLVIFVNRISPAIDDVVVAIDIAPTAIDIKEEAITLIDASSDLVTAIRNTNYYNAELDADRLAFLSKVLIHNRKKINESSSALLRSA